MCDLKLLSEIFVNSPVPLQKGHEEFNNSILP